MELYYIVCSTFIMFGSLLWALVKDCKLNLFNLTCLSVSVFLGVYINIAGSQFLLPYFVIQSINDVKEQKVYYLPNILAIILSVPYAFGSVSTILYGAILIVLLYFSKYGDGDKKCIFALYLVFQFYEVFDGIFYLLLSVFLANLIFIVYGIVKKKDRHVRRAFFPSLFIGYGIVLLLI